MYTAAFETLDERFGKLAFENVHLEKLYTGCRWAEGPAYLPAGKYLVWSDIPNDRLLRFDETSGAVSVFLQPANNHNGHSVDREGRLVCCEHRGRCISRIEHDGSRRVLADRFQGKRLNSPNDAVVKSDGSIWFTDPSYGIDSDYEGDASPAEIGACNVYRFDPASGEVTAVATDFVKPNGLAFSPDEKYLYVDDSASKTYWRFTVRPDGTLANKKLLIDMSSSKEAGVPDGMKIDQKGNIYGAGPGGVWVLTPEGKHLGTIRPPENPANLAWGDADGKTLYFTAVTGLYRLRVNIPGVRP
jgi:gluconolactonase